MACNSRDGFICGVYLGEELYFACISERGLYLACISESGIYLVFIT